MATGFLTNVLLAFQLNPALMPTKAVAVTAMRSC